MIVDPSGTNLGSIDLARTPDERGRGLGKSGFTESATPMGIVRAAEDAFGGSAPSRA